MGYGRGAVANETITRAVERLATRGTQTEADIQSDIQTILAGGELNLTFDDVPKLEQQTADGTRRRIDVAICHCVIEVKKDLRSPAVRPMGRSSCVATSTPVMRSTTGGSSAS